MSTAVDCARPRSSEATSPLDRRGALWELVIGYGLLEAALWSEGDLRWVWTAAVLLWILVVTAYHRPTWSQLGLGWTGFRRSLWAAGLAAVAGALMLVGARWAGTLHVYPLRRLYLEVAAGYLVWTLEQEFMLQSFFFLRLEKLLGSRKAVWAGAALFAIAHIPNPVLVPATFAAGLAFCAVFRKYRNLYTLAIAQAILGICLAAAVPDALHHHMHVGIGYYGWVRR
jgi:membrane protease YdiL (CAAX protease family)